MRFPLQQIGHRESPYERPNQKWECGWRCQGKGCDAGPDDKGRCQVQLQTFCEPRKKGDRWECSRLPMYGGACEKGPSPSGECCQPAASHPPCKPRRRLRARRGRLVVAVAMLTIGLLAIGLAGPWSLAMMSPGQVASVHEGFDFAAMDHANQCAVCHANAEGGNALSAMLASMHGEIAFADSKRCATCHFSEDDVHSGLAMGVHSADPASIRAATARGASDGSAALSLAGLVGPAMDPGDPLACSVCHREHHGLDHDLTFMSNQSCQACHASAFTSFTQGHPAFHAEPAAPGIQYDHLAHQRREADAYNCATCHETSPGMLGQVVGLKPFAQSCSACHAEELAKLAEPMPILKLPVMEVDAEWYSEDAVMQDEEGPMPLMTYLLLSGDERVRPSLQLLASYGMLDAVVEFDLEEPEQKEALAEGFKSLLADLVAEDPTALRQRLASALGLPADDARVASLTDQIGPVRESAFLFCLDFLVDLEFDEPAVDGVPPFVSTLPDAEDEDPSIRYLIVDAEKTAGHPVLNANEAHADPMIVALLNALDAASRSANAPAGGDDEAVDLPTELFAAFSSEWNATCLRCHSTEDADGRLRLIWQSPPRSAGFAKFDHATHVARFDAVESCQQCHAWADQTGGIGFVPTANNQCITCHAPHQPGGDACTTCHNYHHTRPLTGWLRGR